MAQGYHPCPRCGTPMWDTARFCPHCGAQGGYRRDGPSGLRIAGAVLLAMLSVLLIGSAVVIGLFGACVVALGGLSNQPSGADSGMVGVIAIAAVLVALAGLGIFGTVRLLK